MFLIIVSILGLFVVMFIYIEDTRLKSVLNKNSFEENEVINDSDLSSKAEKDSVLQQIDIYTGSTDEETQVLKKGNLKIE